MKKAILTGAMALIMINIRAQSVTDTVSLGAAYANQVWYSLANDEQGAAPKNNWDLAFDATGFGATVLTNSVSGVMLWNYPHADTAGWATIDTAGLSGWPTRYNSDTSWALGAMGRYANPANDNDLDWGVYNMTTHTVTGDSVYIVRLGDGSYRKLRILSLVGAAYSFRYANLDGTDQRDVLLAKAAYTGKNFGYYSLRTHTALDREPAAASWDLVFGQYTGFVPSAYTVTGVLTNRGAAVAKCINIGNTATYTDWASGTFSTAINTIGYNWKTFNGSSYDAVDSTVYFVKTAGGDIWKLLFTGFGGSANGNCMFSKERLFTQTSVPVAGGAFVASLALYPNPASGSAVNVVYSLPGTGAAAQLRLCDIAGRQLLAANIAATTHGQYVIAPGSLAPGCYLITITTNETQLQSKLVVQ